MRIEKHLRLRIAMLHKLHPIREIVHFMNWADLYVAFEVRFLASSYFYLVHELDRK
jgi:hypothetical protein